MGVVTEKTDKWREETIGKESQRTLGEKDGNAGMETRRITSHGPLINVLEELAFLVLSPCVYSLLPSICLQQHSLHTTST